MKLRVFLLAICGALHLARGEVVDPTTLRGKVMAGYQGWFRCPGDAAGKGWVHWSREGKRIAPETLTFEMWPEMSEYGERFAAPGFTYPDGKQAELFSSDRAATVLKHFEWLQHFVVELPGAPARSCCEGKFRFPPICRSSRSANAFLLGDTARRAQPLAPCMLPPNPVHSLGGGN